MAFNLHNYASCVCAHICVPSDAQVVSPPAVPATSPATLKITKHLSVDQTCDVLQQIGLEDCAPIIRKYKVAGKQLLEATQDDFINMLTGGGNFLGFQARGRWIKLRPYLQYS